LFKIFTFLIICFVLNKNVFLNMLPILVIVGILVQVHLGCQEIYYTISNNTPDAVDTLSYTKKLCPSKDKNVNNILRFTRFFGCGTSILLFSLIPIYYMFIE
jgi:hypothetical protein